MKIALTCGPVAIPPTYFVVQHAMLLRDRHEFALFSPSARVTEEVGIPIHSAMMLRPGSRIDTLRVQAVRGRVTRDIRRFEPAVVHQHFATWSLPASSAARRLGVPLVTTLHGYDVFALKRQSAGVWGAITRANLRATTAGTTRFLAVSRWLADRAIADGIDSRRLRVMYQGIDTSFFTPGTPGAEGDVDEPVVLYAGGLVEHKGVRDALRASISLHATTPHRLRLAGGGPLEAEVRSAAREHPHIEVLGPLSRAALREQYRAARVLVMPSRSSAEWSEAAGLVSLEAQACGTPVVAYASGGLTEMVEDSATGTLVPQDDVDALALALHRWITMADLEYGHHRSAGVDFVRSRRSAQGAAEELLSHYNEVTAARGNLMAD
ncbi:glycosyltransferase family 4 protein [Agromyces sp. NPDC058064]|uniref:glycosyltransferase family 4 protein n=1 Tax=Agromyces sp. NPDC058064 TaxID=3346322 RepID=UPI0036DECFBE